MLHRREFIRGAAVAAALLGVPAARAEQVLCEAAPALPSKDLLSSSPQAYWAGLRKQWLLAPDHINLNCGSVGCTPLPVLRAMIDHILSAETFVEAPYPWFGYDENTHLQETCEALADFLHVTTDELALVRNATEANNVVVNGMNLAAGDEVLLTDQEHPGGYCPLDQRVARHGIKLNTVEIPKPPATAEEIVERFQKAITPKTKLIFFSHITTATGVILPAKQICAMAREHGILTHVDGAHAIGQIPLDLTDIGCDFYGSSPHKWLMAPKGTGFLYVRDEMIDRMWSTVTTAGWDDPKIRAERFQRLGSSNVGSLAGLRASVEFANQIGMARIEKRNRDLNNYIWSQMQQRGAENVTGFDAQYRCAIVSVNAPPVHIGDLEKGLWEQSKIRVRGGAPYKIRLSTPYYLQKADIDRFLEKFDEFKKNYKAA